MDEDGNKIVGPDGELNKWCKKKIINLDRIAYTILYPNPNPKVHDFSHGTDYNG